MTAAQGTPNRGKGGKSINLIKFDQFFDFLPKWSWGPLDRLKMLSWSPLRFSTIENCSLRTFTFWSFLVPNRPWPISALVSLGQGHPGVQEPRKLNTSHAKCKSSFNLLILLLFLRVGVTKYCKLQGNLLAGSVTASAHTSRPLYHHRWNPSVQALCGESQHNQVAIMSINSISYKLSGGHCWTNKQTIDDCSFSKRTPINCNCTIN